MFTANNNLPKTRQPLRALPRWGCPRCGLRPTRQLRFCPRCNARMAYSTTDVLKRIEAAYLASSRSPTPRATRPADPTPQWWERY